MRIVLCYPTEERHRQQMLEVMPGAEIVDAGYEHIEREIFSADIFCGHSRFKMLPWDDIVKAGRLKWIQSSAAGMDHCLVPSVIAADITVTSASGVLADQVAEQTLALVLGLCRSLPTFFRAQQIREFERRPTRDLTGATVGLVGFGGNGRRLAEVFAAFRARIIATDVFPTEKPEYVHALWPADQLDRLLAESDVVVLALPLLAETRALFDADRLARMKRGALLINVARGQIVVESALVEALRSGHLAGAGLDVTEQEPLPAESALWELPNVIITPHVGGQSARRADDMTRLFCENLRRWQTGEPLINLVDKQLGFPPSSGRVS